MYAVDLKVCNRLREKNRWNKTYCSLCVFKGKVTLCPNLQQDQEEATNKARLAYEEDMRYFLEEQEVEDV